MNKKERRKAGRKGKIDRKEERKKGRKKGRKEGRKKERKEGRKGGIPFYAAPLAMLGEGLATDPPEAHPAHGLRTRGICKGGYSYSGLIGGGMFATSLGAQPGFLGGLCWSGCWVTGSVYVRVLGLGAMGWSARLGGAGGSLCSPPSPSRDLRAAHHP